MHPGSLKAVVAAAHGLHQFRGRNSGRERYRVVVLAHRDALNVYRTSNRNWTYLSPAMQNFAGERTGRFRVGGNKLMADAEGKTRISYEDIAVALLDEVESPRHIEKRFCVAY